ncbi:hypothetical protein ACTOJ1_000051 [Shigella flexneri]
MKTNLSLAHKIRQKICNKNNISFLNNILVVLFVISLVFHFYVVYYSINLSIENFNNHTLFKSFLSIVIATLLILLYFVKQLHLFIFLAMFCVFKVYLGVEANPIQCIGLALIPVFLYWGRDYVLRYMTKIRYS